MVYMHEKSEHLFKRYREMKDLLIQKFEKKFLECNSKKSRSIFEKTESRTHQKASLVSPYLISKLVVIVNSSL